MFAIHLSGCATTITNNDKRETKNQWGNIYSGTYCGIKFFAGLPNDPIYIIATPIIAIDFVLSLTVDTLLVPFELMAEDNPNAYYCGSHP